ncbi:MAG: hypothetical protein HXS48_26480 [Theionarchaea archaeon]|nr:hypothetical protein [Theionarchaea archaeon]
MVKISEDFSPQLKSTVETSPFDTIEDGEFLLLRNPENARYLKLKEKAKEIIEKMDGKTSVAQLQGMYKDIDVVHLIEVLAKAGFLIDVEAEKYTGPLYTVKIPFFDTNKEWMKKVYRFFRFTGSKPFLVVYSLFILSGFILFLKNFGTIVDHAYMNFHLGVPLKYLFAVFALFYVVELVHEFAHTGASYNCGAEPGKLGLVFHFLVAFFYVDTPNTRILDKRGNVCTFIAGPLLSLLAAEISTYIFLFTDSMPIVWATSSFFWHISTAITLSPFMQTDGYYIVQFLAKFPNLLDNSLTYLKTQVKRGFQLINKEEYKKTMAKWNDKQKKFLKVYMILWPVQTLILTYFFFFSLSKAQVIGVLKVFPEIISPASPYGPKGYFLAAFYAWGIIAGILPIALTIRKYIKKRRGDDYSIRPR